jgi:phage tail sheath protein FI
MTDIFLHGIQTLEQNNGPRPVATIDTGVIGLIATAPDAIAELYPLNVPILINGIDGIPAGLGATGTAIDAIEAIFAQATRASQTIVLVLIEDDEDPLALMSNALGSPVSKTGMYAFERAKSDLNVTPKILIAPGMTGALPTDGVASITVTAGGEDYVADTTTVTITDTHASPTGFGATATAVVNSDTGAITGIVITNPGSSYKTPTVTITGAGTGATATATAGTVANPVAIGLEGIAKRLRAIVVADGPNTTNAAAVTYRNKFDTDRVYIVDPHIKALKAGTIVSRPPSPYVAGLIAVTDYEFGFWHSPSNKVVSGVIGIARPITHSISDPSAESQYLNKNDVACIVRGTQGGFVLWGNRVPSSDSLKKFLSVRRAHDTIIESIELAHLPFIDKPFSLQILTDIAETVNSALRKWQALGATLGGRVWLDPQLNTKETWASGKLYVSYDAEGPAPLEQITFVFNRNTGYYEELARQAIEEISRLTGRTV